MPQFSIVVVLEGIRCAVKSTAGRLVSIFPIAGRLRLEKDVEDAHHIQVKD